MLKFFDKFIPTLFTVFSILIFSLAFHLYNNSLQAETENSIFNENTTKKLLFSSNLNKENLQERYKNYISENEVLIQEMNKNFEMKAERSGPLKVLIVPGHDHEFSGAEFNSVKEADLNLKVAQSLYEFLSNDSGFEPHITRNENGYTEEFQKYLDENIEEVLIYRRVYGFETEGQKKSGEYEPNQTFYHNTAPLEMIYRLYAFNKWVSDNDIDIVLHIHFNDYPGRGRFGGKYEGFSIFVNDENSRNGKISKELAEKTKETLSRFFAQSSNPAEKDIIIESPDLIAVGANNTIDAISVLFEYGYVYENQFLISPLNQNVFKELAYQTYLGLRDFLINIPASKDGYSILLPKDISEIKDAKFGDKASLAVLKLQALLSVNGFYPADNKTLNDCPVGGNFLNCTKEAVLNFQKNKKIKKSGVLDEETLEELEKLL